MRTWLTDCECVTLLLDFAVGFCAVVAMTTLSLFTGGFNSFTPWIIWGVILLFTAGFIRSVCEGEAVWLRGISINACSLIAVAALLRGPWWAVPLSAAGTILPTIAGLTARRALKQAGR